MIRFRPNWAAVFIFLMACSLVFASVAYAVNDPK